MTKVKNKRRPPRKDTLNPERKVYVHKKRNSLVSLFGKLEGTRNTVATLEDLGL